MNTYRVYRQEPPEQHNDIYHARLVEMPFKAYGDDAKSVIEELSSKAEFAKSKGLGKFPIVQQTFKD